jgi:hypothetical protein
MQLWYFMIIGIPIVTSFIISLIVYIVYSKLMRFEMIDPATGKGKYRCKGASSDNKPKNANVT